MTTKVANNAKKNRYLANVFEYHFGHIPLIQMPKKGFYKKAAKSLLLCLFLNPLLHALTSIQQEEKQDKELQFLQQEISQNSKLSEEVATAILDNQSEIKRLTEELERTQAELKRLKKKQRQGAIFTRFANSLTSLFERPRLQRAISNLQERIQQLTNPPIEAKDENEEEKKEKKEGFYEGVGGVVGLFGGAVLMMFAPVVVAPAVVFASAIAGAGIGIGVGRAVDTYIDTPAKAIQTAAFVVPGVVAAAPLIAAGGALGLGLGVGVGILAPFYGWGIVWCLGKIGVPEWSVPLGPFSPVVWILKALKFDLPDWLMVLACPLPLRGSLAFLIVVATCYVIVKWHEKYQRKQRRKALKKAIKSGKYTAEELKILYPEYKEKPNPIIQLLLPALKFGRKALFGG